MNRIPVILAAFTTSLLLAGVLGAQEWKPADGPLMTRWAAEVSPANVWPEYPRPQLARPVWQNLNGLWDYAIRPRDDERPEEFDGKILVPFAIESALSGVMKRVGEDNRLWYRRTFEVARRRDERILLHFGAVDWHARVVINGKEAGEHRGGYDPFTFDITDLLESEGEQEIVVSVWDPTDRGFQPRGKQVREPEGIWYTPVTGIWQTVWLEPVPAASIRSLKLVPDVDAGVLRVTVDGRGTNDGHWVAATAREGNSVVASARGTPGETFELAIPAPRLWSPQSPFLYDLRVVLGEERRVVDEVESYFGMRKIEVRRHDDGFNRLFLNNEPLFHFGPLDQGWWPDGLYTAPTDAALRYDIEVTRALGFNTARKHVKVEPARWYYHCDRLGLLVWQDLPNGDRHIGPNQPDLERSEESAANYRRELKAMIDAYFNHPSIVVWVPFNEGWGQFDTDAVLAWTKEYDPSRLVDGPSGWADRGSGDLHDMHRYPGPGMPEPEEERAVVLGEFGGLGLPVEEHLWWNRRNWGYRTYRTFEELRFNYATLIRRLRPLIGAGLAAAIYTQTTDVEGEVNGLMTYDRAIVKFDQEELAKLHATLYGPQPRLETRSVVATSQEAPQTWRYTTDSPGDGWEARVFDDSGWQEGPGGFGTRETPGTVVRTVWDSEDIWIRREFELPAVPENVYLRVHHDEDAEIYLNGVLAARVQGYTTAYEDFELGPEARAALVAGRNTLAVHCRQTRGGQYIDVGLLDVKEIWPDSSRPGER